MNTKTLVFAAPRKSVTRLWTRLKKDNVPSGAGIAFCFTGFVVFGAVLLAPLEMTRQELALSVARDPSGSKALLFAIGVTIAVTVLAATASMLWKRFVPACKRE